MPRNSSGVYSLPAGNPVVTGTTISSVWANATLSDIGTALTDSLSRSGDGGMTAPLELDDGAIGAPGLSWTTEPTSGLYRAGAGDFRYSVGAADALQILAGATRFVGGSVGTPGIGFITDSNTGLFHLGADNLGVAVGGASALDITSSRVAVTASALWAPNGTVGAPSYAFANDNNTGIYWGGADNLRLVTGGILALEIGNAQRLWAVDGTVGAPAYSFASDTDTGVYRGAANNLRLCVGGLNAITVDTAGVYSHFPNLAIGDGSSANPQYSFNSDPDTGIFRANPNDMRFVAGGNQRILVRTTDVIINGVPILVGNGSASVPTHSFENDLNTGMYLGGTDDIRISAGGNDMVIADSVNNTMRLGKDASTVINFFTSTSGSASAGGGASIPATVTGFMTILVNGSTRKIPYYNS